MIFMQISSGFGGWSYWQVICVTLSEVPAKYKDDLVTNSWVQFSQEEMLPVLSLDGRDKYCIIYILCL